MSIHSRWHRLRDAAAKGSLCLATDAKTAIRPADLPSGSFDVTAFREALDAMDGTPRLVMAEGLPELSVTNQAMLSLADMHHCGVLDLPFPRTVVEYDAGDTRYSVCLSRASDEAAAAGFPWQSSAVATYVNDGEDVAMAFPGILRLGLTVPSQPEGAGAAPPMPTFGYRIALPPYLAMSDAVEGYVIATADLIFRRCVVAFLCGVLMPNTLGLERETVAARSLNRSRVAKGRHAIPDHTLLRLGSYLSRSGERVRIEGGASPEVHLRRGHKRRVAIGQGRTGRAWRFFAPQIVGFLPDGTKPTMVEMLATRAAKPYLVRR